MHNHLGDTIFLGLSIVIVADEILVAQTNEIWIASGNLNLIKNLKDLQYKDLCGIILTHPKRVQWAAVTTKSSLINTPPQLNSGNRGINLLIAGLICIYIFTSRVHKTG